ncbi:MAG: gluconeogenesis factor YvcK family protein [bacterium]
MKNLKHNLVCLGGGTGQAAVLKGLKNKNFNLTAIVAVTDNGGSSGRIRRSMGIPQPGDSRNCLVAVSNPENILTKLFEYRFCQGDLQGINLGNLIIAALTRIFGDFGEAVAFTNQMLKTKAQILPVSNQSTQICAELQNNKKIIGEWEIISRKSKLRIKKAYLRNKIFAFVPALQAIKKADLIIIGPGSFYTALISNLLVSGIKQAIKNSKAKTLYICNLMSQPGQTTGLGVKDHVLELEKYLDKKLDYILVNNKKISKKILDIYQEFNSHQIILDLKDIRIIQASLAQNIIGEAVRKDKRSGKAFKEWSLWTHILRHDSEKLGEEIAKILTNIKK